MLSSKNVLMERDTDRDVYPLQLVKKRFQVKLPFFMRFISN